MDKLREKITEEDYKRISGKIFLERKNLLKRKEELEQKINQTNKIDYMELTQNEENEIYKLIVDFLKLEKMDKIYID